MGHPGYVQMQMRGILRCAQNDNTLRGWHGAGGAGASGEAFTSVVIHLADGDGPSGGAVVGFEFAAVVVADVGLAGWGFGFGIGVEAADEVGDGAGGEVGLGVVAGEVADGSPGGVDAGLVGGLDDGVVEEGRGGWVEERLCGQPE